MHEIFSLMVIYITEGHLHRLMDEEAWREMEKQTLMITFFLERRKYPRPLDQVMHTFLYC